MAQEGVQYVVETDISDALSDFQTLGSQLKKVETNIEDSKTDFVKLGTAIEDSGKHVDAFDDQIKKIPKSTKTAKTGIDDLMDGMKKLVTIGAIVGTTKKIVDIYGDFENQMNAVQAVSGSTGEEMEKLSNLANKLGADTNYSAPEAGAAEEALLRLGNSASDTMTMVGDVMDFDRANKVGDLAKSAEILSSELKMFGLEAAESTRVADAMAMTTKNSKTTVEYLGSAFNNAGADAKALGYDIEDTLTLVGAMSTNFDEGTSAGTALKGMFADLSNNSDKFKKFLKVDVADQNGKFRQVEDIVKDINTALSNKTPLEQQKLLNACFGETGKAAYNALSAAGGSFDKLEDKIRNASGTTQTMADIMDRGLKPKIDGMIGSAETLAITIGEKLKPTFLLVVDTTTKLINKTSDMITNWDEFYTKNEELIDGLGILATGVLTYIGVTKTMLFWDKLVLASKVEGTIANFLYSTSLGMSIAFMEAGGGITGAFAAAQWGLNAAFAANPIGFVITGVALLIIGFRYAWKHVSWFKDGVLKLWEVFKIATPFGMILDGLDLLAEKFGWVKDIVDGFKKGVSWLWTGEKPDFGSDSSSMPTFTGTPQNGPVQKKITDYIGLPKTGTNQLINTNLYPQNKPTINPKSVPATTTTNKNSKTEVKTTVTQHITINEANKMNIDELTNKISKKVTNNISGSFLEAAKLAGVN